MKFKKINKIKSHKLDFGTLTHYSVILREGKVNSNRRVEIVCYTCDKSIYTLAHSTAAIWKSYITDIIGEYYYFTCLGKCRDIFNTCPPQELK